MQEKNYLRLPNPPKEVIDFSHEMYEKYSKLEWNNPMSEHHFTNNGCAKRNFLDIFSNSLVYNFYIIDYAIYLRKCHATYD